MFKKYILALLGAALVYGANAASVTTTVTNGAMVNLLSGFSQPVTVKQIILSANSNAVTGLLVYDVSTNSISIVNSSYTTTTSYATNWNTTWTNYYGVVQTNEAPVVALI